MSAKHRWSSDPAHRVNVEACIHCGCLRRRGYGRWFYARPGEPWADVYPLCAGAGEVTP